MPVTDSMRELYCEVCIAYDNSDGSSDVLSFEEVVILKYTAKLRADNKALLDALKDAQTLLNHMGDVLNGMDAATPEDVKMATPIFAKVRAAIEHSDPQ